jgi:two-component system, OmpR family, response regulator MprA
VREFDLIECFLRNPRQVLSRSQLIQHVWGEDYFGDDNVVDVYVRYVRRKLEEVKQERIIHTVRGIGFALRLEE